MTTGPARKLHIELKSPLARVTQDITLIFAMCPPVLIVAPLAGRYLAARFGLQPVFLVSMLLGCALYRADCELPFVVVIVIALILLVPLVTSGRRGLAHRPHGGLGGSEGTD